MGSSSVVLRRWSVGRFRLVGLICRSPRNLWLRRSVIFTRLCRLRTLRRVARTRRYLRLTRIFVLNRLPLRFTLTRYVSLSMSLFGRLLAVRDGRPLLTLMIRLLLELRRKFVYWERRLSARFRLLAASVVLWSRFLRRFRLR